MHHDSEKLVNQLLSEFERICGYGVGPTSSRRAGHAVSRVDDYVSRQDRDVKRWPKATRTQTPHKQFRSVRAQLQCLRVVYIHLRNMSDFEDHNPFRTDDDGGIHSDPEVEVNIDADGADSPDGSASNVDLSSEPATPPAHPARILASPPTSPGVNRGFAASASGTGAASTLPRQAPTYGLRPPQQQFKSDFCCSMDRWLHSGEDVEIHVRSYLVAELCARN